MTAISTMNQYPTTRFSSTGSVERSEIDEPTQSYNTAIIQMIVKLMELQSKLAETNANEIGTSAQISDKSLEIIKANTAKFLEYTAQVEALQKKDKALGLFMKILDVAVCVVSSLVLAAMDQWGAAFMGVLLCAASVSGGMNKLMQAICPPDMKSGERLAITAVITVALAMVCATLSSAIDSLAAAGLATLVKTGVQVGTETGSIAMSNLSKEMAEEMADEAADLETPAGSQIVSEFKTPMGVFRNFGKGLAKILPTMLVQVSMTTNVGGTLSETIGNIFSNGTSKEVAEIITEVILGIMLLGGLMAGGKINLNFHGPLEVAQFGAEQSKRCAAVVKFFGPMLQKAMQICTSIFTFGQAGGGIATGVMDYKQGGIQKDMGAVQAKLNLASQLATSNSQMASRIADSGKTKQDLLSSALTDISYVTKNAETIARYF